MAGRRYALTMIFVSLFTAVTLSILYTNAKGNESDQRWCALLSTLDSTYKTTPPTSEPGKAVARDIARLHDQLDCEGTDTNGR